MIPWQMRVLTASAVVAGACVVGTGIWQEASGADTTPPPTTVATTVVVQIPGPKGDKGERGEARLPGFHGVPREAG